MLKTILFDSFQSITHPSRALGIKDEGEISDLSLVKPFSHLKIFTGQRMMMTDLSTQNFMYKFPQLQSLNMNSSPNEDCEIMVLQSFDLSEESIS
jgi:hypothetical protein